MNMGMFRNEMQCLSNAVLQSAIKHEMASAWAVADAMRFLVNSEKLALADILYVRLFQEAVGQGIVQCGLVIGLADGTARESQFQFSSLTAKRFNDYVLYDRDRDGEVKFLHLVH